MSKIIDGKPRKFIQEFLNEQKKVIARWHYDLDKFSRGPIQVENFDMPPKERKSKRKI